MWWSIFVTSPLHIVSPDFAQHLEFQLRSLAVLSEAADHPESVFFLFQHLTHLTQPWFYIHVKSWTENGHTSFHLSRKVASTHVTRLRGCSSFTLHLAIRHAASPGGEKRVSLIKINSRLRNNSCPHYSEGCQSNPERWSRMQKSGLRSQTGRSVKSLRGKKSFPRKCPFSETQRKRVNVWPISKCLIHEYVLKLL